MTEKHTEAIILLITKHACNAERKGYHMKIEKVNENQIRCTLTREDLISRELKISELAYGTEKAKNLFRDMMRQANYEFGFEAEDIPLMIEAIPLNSECIVLIITKVEDPEELDTRFSRFAPSITEDTDDEADSFDEDGSDEVMDLFRRIQPDSVPKNASLETPASAGNPASRIYRIGSLQQVISICHIIEPHFCGTSTLYKEEASGTYLLLLDRGEESAEDFEKVCNVVSEYGALLRNLSGSTTFLAEHNEALLSGNAVSVLADM